MKITKFEHACFTVEQDRQSIVIDPGAYTTDFTSPENVVAVVITHEHADHLDKGQLADIITKNPDAVVVAHESVTAQLDNLKTQSVTANEGFKIGAFALEFYGGDHAVIHPDIPRIANLGVMINDTVYYPGDSFTVPERDVHVLALPIAAPWMKISEAVDFVRAVRPRIIFPTHDAISSDPGKQLADTLIPSVMNLPNVSYSRLSSPLEV